MANNYKYNPNLRHFEVPCLRGVAKASIVLIGASFGLFAALQMTLPSKTPRTINAAWRKANDEKRKRLAMDPFSSHKVGHPAKVPDFGDSL